jgi:predicted nucleic acid-binding Zn ribbon protein
MDAQLTPISEETSYCKSCSAPATANDQFCADCGYPLQGTEQEQKKFMMDKSYKELNLDEARKQVKRASYALYYIAGATFLGGLIVYGVDKHGSQNGTVLLINVIIAVIFAAIGFWCMRKPLAAIITGASFYALIVILNAVSNPLTILSGIIFKIFIVGCFIRGIKSALEAEKLKKELNIG